MRSLSLFQSLWKHRHLLWQFTIRQVELRHKGSHLGLIWSFLNPLLMLGLYVLVFGYIFHGRFQDHAEESRIEYALVVFLGLAIYHFVAEVLSTSATLITSNPNYVKKVIFPLEILPIANVGAAFFHFVITLFLVCLGAALTTKVSLTAGVLWLPVILLPLVAIVVGAALMLSALGVFWRDVSQIIQFSLLVLMFASAVFYPISQIPAPAWAILKFNPFIHVINEARSVAFWGYPPNPAHLVYLYLFGTGAIIAGTTTFQRVRGNFADVL